MSKALSIIGAIFLILSFTACSTDNDDNLSNRSNNFEGVWRLSMKTIETPIDFHNDGNLTDVVYIGTNSPYDTEIIINNNNSGIIYFSDNFTYNTRDENGTLVYMVASSINNERVDIPFSYMLSNNSGIINYNDIEATFLLEGNTLFMTIDDGFVAKDIDTFETTVVQDLTYVFKKQ
ncbi:hypothetical protein [Hanstruepera ponticola]|uniref:hypothetical protein n=1 Tax=Hanstruepera ponticola TaxID=2042995 RepID=UPI000CF0A1FF|nr:hypothetical protein [Hanstruepera ponticola]